MYIPGSYNLVRTFCHTSWWALDTVTLRYALSCSLVRAFCHDDIVGLVYGRKFCFQISPENSSLLPSTRLSMKMRAHYSRLGPMMVRCTDADAVSCAVHTLVLEPHSYLSSSNQSCSAAFDSVVLTLFPVVVLVVS